MMAAEEESAENLTLASSKSLIKRLADQNRRHGAYIDQVTQALKKSDKKTLQAKDR